MILSIITPTYNRQDWLRKTITAVLAQDTAGVEVEYLVIDNNSKDGTREVVEEMAKASPGIQLRYILEKRQGANQARNTGIEAARGDYLLFFDDDIDFEKDVLKAYIEAFRNFPEALVFGGRISVKKTDFTLPSWLVLDGPLARTMIVLRMEHGEHCEEREISEEDMPIGPSMAFKREVFERCGNFRVDFGLSGKSLVPGAEYELLLRVKRTGIPNWIYVGNARVHHPIKKSQARKAYFRERMFGVGRVLYRLNVMEARWRIFGLPVYILEFIAKNALRSLACRLQGKAPEAFFYQCEALVFCGYTYQHFLNRKSGP